MRARQDFDAAAELALCRRMEVNLISRGEPVYPPPLENIPDPPGLLYVKGKIEPRDQLAIAVVGSRHCTPYGTRTAERLASALARTGFTVVSGLARGIDAAAHRGAIKAGGRTIGVLANGLASVYPPEHEDLARAVVEAGALDQRNADAARSAWQACSRSAIGSSPACHWVCWSSRRPRGAGLFPPPVTPWNRIARSSPFPGQSTVSRAGAAIA